MKKTIIITGFPYAYPYYFRVFDYLSDKSRFIFILPKLWLAKEGKVKIEIGPRRDVFLWTGKVLSFGGKTLLRGIFKGFMPILPLYIIRARFGYMTRTMYSCSEPNLLTTLYNGLFVKIFGMKHVLFTWQNVEPEKRLKGIKLRLSNYLVKLNLFLSDGIICGNQKAAQIIRKFIIHNSKFKILVCPLSGIDIEKFKPEYKGAWKSKLGIKDKIVLFYGALEKRKGLDTLLCAFNIYVSKYQDAKLIIIGTGPEKEKLHFLSDELDIKDKIIFYDWMKNDELPQVLNSADVFVYPSIRSGGWEEQFGYAMAEASACAVPVISTISGSIDEVIVNNSTGILVEPGKEKDLASALEKILSDEQLARQMGVNGREYIVSHFSNKIIAQKIEEFISSI
jgi:glycosyltransferase involved in cell wall biosynthesis